MMGYILCFILGGIAVGAPIIRRYVNIIYELDIEVNKFIYFLHQHKFKFVAERTSYGYYRDIKIIGKRI